MSDYKYGLKPTTKFKKDYKLAKKRGLDMSLLEYVIDELLLGHTLDAKYLDHPLHGDYEGFNECHIQPDWLLIYGKDEENLILTAVRTGKHTDLFKSY
ncbi:MAG: type II toxin-antitoxin system YafQ family toxin [Butyrivibrio sp.]|uniref:type II toxin-antitoxin system YafQ family toxin n=1 Tax=Butyrivibrio sp. TaxID=28121 RepID=UPI001B04230E|nr:type II toxin-antitoxin system YafQ family toxin [Butyrivibrio sp.]MBO6242115.1 type II toxin-antitoxin system YafQ family toxin [Butyrivibrio sp.]